MVSSSSPIGSSVLGPFASQSTSSTSPFQPITFAGIVSGINTAALIQSILAQRQQPITNYQNQIAAEKAKAAAVAEISGRLSNLLTAIKQFSDPNYLQGKAASVQPGGSSPQVSVTASATAAAQTFKVTVQQLATSTSVTSPSAIGAAIDPTVPLNQTNLATAVTAGTFTVNGQQITVDPTTDTLNSVMAKIQAAIPGSTNLLASPGGTTRTSTAPLGVTETSVALQNAHLAGSLGGTSGSFVINGQTFTWDATAQSLNNIISAINANTAANVIATYNPTTDTVTLTSKSTGSTAIQLQDTSGTLLQALGLTGQQTLGKNAQYTIDTGSGPQTQYSTTNTVQNALPGVTLNLLQTGTTPDTVTIGQDVSGTVSKIQNLVSQINGVLDDIRTQTAINPPTSTTNGTGPQQSQPNPQNGPLAGDTTIEMIADQLRTFLISPMPGVSGPMNTLQSIGISFGAPGSALGTTNDLQVDTNTLTNALQTNPVAVANLFAAFGSQIAIQSGGAGNITSATGQPTGVRVPGTYSITTTVNGDGTANMTATFTPASGGTPMTTSLTNLQPGTTNTTLIPGVTLTFPSTFTAGTDTLNLTTPTLGLEAQFEQYLTPLTQAGGVLSSIQSGYQTDISDLQDQINEMNANLQIEKQMLVNKFAAMEIALQQLQTQQQALNAAGLTGQLTAGGVVFG